MQIGLKPPVSLSMRLRAEASIPPIRKDDSVDDQSISGSKQFGKTLPHIGTTTSMSTLGTSSSPGRKKEFRYPFEALSGSYDWVASSGVFADRSVMVNPAAVCVRCSEHASMCMSCTEILCQEGLNFYRKTRARGAASLFANAITQTGVTKVVKAAIFKLWVNGLRSRKSRERKQAFACDKLYKIAITKAPFRAWRGYAKSELFGRKEKQIEELSEKLLVMEALVQKSHSERAAFEQQAKFVTKLLSERDSAIEAMQIKEVANDEIIREGKDRVIGLASLCGAVTKYSTFLGSLIKSTSDSLHQRLLRNARSTVSATDYSRIFDSDTYRSLIKEHARRKEQRKIVKIDETVDIIELLLEWVTKKSRDAKLVVTADGGDVESMLPKHRVIETVDDLINGHALLRCVVALIFESAVDNTTLMVADTEQPPTCHLSSMELMSDIKQGGTSPSEIIAKMLKLANKYLYVPLFKAKDISGGKSEVIVVLLGYLMLASTSTSAHSTVIQQVGDLIRAYGSINRDIDSADRAVKGYVDEVDTVYQRWLEYRGLKEVEEVGGTVCDAAVPVEGGIAGHEETTIDHSALPTSTSTSTLPAPELHLITDPTVKYQKLLVAVDACLKGMGTGVGALTGTGGLGGTGMGGKGGKNIVSKTAPIATEPLLLSHIATLESNLESLQCLKKTVDEMETAREKGVRLASDVRCSMAGFQFELMLEEMHWVSH